jgi:hypothetical protein
MSLSFVPLIAFAVTSLAIFRHQRHTHRVSFVRAQEKGFSQENQEE